MSLAASMRGLKLRLSAAYRLGSFLRPAENRVAYIGPGRSTNLGDRCMLEAYRRLLPTFEFAVVPHGDPSWRLAALDRFTGGRTLAAIALGGGTLIGSPRYRRQLESLIERFPDVPTFMFGVGVEDPTPVNGRQMATVQELRLWSGVLQRCEAVTVRGPRSREILADLGISSHVVGDSALVLGDSQPSEKFEPRLLGLNVGVSNPIWGGSPQRVKQEVVRAARILGAKGWRIRVLPVWPADLEYSLAVAAAIGPDVEVRRHFGNVDLFLDAARECDVFVGLKLHSAVLASTVFVPTLMLEYRPKCLDFQLSLGREDHTIRTDVIDARDLAQRVEEMSENRPDHQSAIFQAVSRSRSLLMDAAREQAGSR